MPSVLKTSILIAVLSFLSGPETAMASGQQEFDFDRLEPAKNNISLKPGNPGIIDSTHGNPSEKMYAEFSPSDPKEDPFDSNIPSKTVFTFEDMSTLTFSEDTKFNINNQVYNPNPMHPGTIAKRSILSMSASSVVDTNDSLAGQNPGSNETVVNVSSGWVRYKRTKDAKNGSSFKVVTPSATAGARGTEFLTIVNAKGKTTFLVLEGQIAAFSNPLIDNGGKPSLISEGEAQDFYPDGSVSKVRRILRNF